MSRIYSISINPRDDQRIKFLVFFFFCNNPSDLFALSRCSPARPIGVSSSFRSPVFFYCVDGNYTAGHRVLTFNSARIYTR